MNADGATAPTRPRLGRLALRAIAAALLLTLAIAWVGPQRLAAQLSAVDPGWFALAVACAIGANLVSAWRWAYLARALGLHAPLPPLVSAYAQGITLNVLLPGATVGGDALRSVRLTRYGNPLAASALSVLLDRASGLWVLCVMSLAATAGFAAWSLATADAAGRAVWAAFSQAAGVLGLAVYVIGLVAAVGLPLLPWRMPASNATTAVDASKRASPLGARLATRLAELHRLAVSRRPALARSLLPSLGVQLLSAGTLWLCARAVGAEPGYLATLAIAAPIFIAAALPLSLGGFGPREFAAALAFPLIGATAQAGVASAVLYGLTAVAQGVLAAPLLAFNSGTK